MNILCPNCKNKLIRNDRTFSCVNRHSFDISKEGYVNLNLHNSQSTGDNAEMINARRDFLNNGYYSFLRDAVNNLLDEDDTLVDLACGEGYYTKEFKCKEKIGIDLSKQGLKIASKNDKNTTYLLSSIFHSPLEDNSVDKVITIFAPVAKEEIVRILKEKGQFILVKPNVEHLYELKASIYEKPYKNEIEEIEIEGLKLIKEIDATQKTLVKKEDVNKLFMMTPYYHKTSLKDKEKLNTISDLEITFSFLIDIYQK